MTIARQTICERYLDALNRSDLDAVLTLFEPGASVVSPLYGTRPAPAFFADLFSDTAQSRTTLMRVFDSASDGAAIALQFAYEWTLADGKVVGFECVDVFEIAPGADRFGRLTIIYDTAPLRADFDAARQSVAVD